MSNNVNCVGFLSIVLAVVLRCGGLRRLARLSELVEAKVVLVGASIGRGVVFVWLLGSCFGCGLVTVSLGGVVSLLLSNSAELDGWVVPWLSGNHRMRSCGTDWALVIGGIGSWDCSANSVACPVSSSPPIQVLAC